MATPPQIRFGGEKHGNGKTKCNIGEDWDI